MANVIYNDFKEQLLKGSFNLHTGGDTIKVALVTSSYTPDQDAHDFFDDVTNEVSGTGYSAGGNTLASQAVSQDNTDNEAVFDASDTNWASSTITARGAVVYKSTGTASTSPLICYFDFGSDQTSSSGNFTITWNSEGIVNLG